MVIKKATPEWMEIAHRLWETRVLRLKYEKEEKALTDMIKGISENSVVRGGDFLWSYTTRAGSIDYDAIPELRMVNRELYRKESIQVWKIEKIEA